MNEDILEGKWMQLRGFVREKWGELTDDELDQIAGRRDRLAGLLQERYGYAKDEVERQADRRFPAGTRKNWPLLGCGSSSDQAAGKHVKSYMKGDADEYHIADYPDLAARECIARLATQPKLGLRR